MDKSEGAFGETASGVVPIVPGKPEDSELIRRISSDDEDERMPPVDSGKSLNADQIALLCRWVEQGSMEGTLGFYCSPAPGTSPGKRPRLAAQCHRQFHPARLDQEGWKPSPEADKEILIRRVTFDLTGLPPTLAEVDAFLADDSPDAYERVVDRLLQSPHYGEHMARFWLDAARYADTHGLHLDNFRQMWLYRDWVVRAFNNNLPYDQFTIQQLAGDLLPSPTIDQSIATGFCRCHVTTNEGGSIEEEVYVRNVVDRVSTTGEVFLGVTLGCAVCHDHKFDPITQKEYYQLFAFFNNLDGPSMDGNVEDPAPVVRVPSKEQTASLNALREKIGATRSQRDERMQTTDPAFADWLSDRLKQKTSGKNDPEFEVEDGLIIRCNFDLTDDNHVVNEADPEKPGRVVGTPKTIEGPAGNGLEFAANEYVDFGDIGDLDDEKPFGFGAWIKTGKDFQGTILAKMDVADLEKGYDLSVADGTVTVQMSKSFPGYGLKVSTKHKVLQPGKWQHVFVTYNGSRLASGVVIYVDGEPQPLDVVSDSLKYKGKIRNNKSFQLGRRDQESGFEGGAIDDARVYVRRLSDADVRAIYLSSQLPRILETPRENWTAEQQQMFRQFYFSQHDPEFIEYTNQLNQLSDEFQKEEAKVPSTLVFREGKKKLDAYVLIRGQYDQHGDKVERRTPAFLPPMDDNLPKNRLGLAKWIVSAENPLTSRVAVNRFWQQAFGIGLVKTSEDFGSQGSPPSNPELLDWLAVEFRESGWDIKALMKMIVMSATYRQSSYTTPLLAKQDPENRLLARGPRFRLDAEMLRDQALSVSGLLVDQMGGPSVKPPQPEGLWEAVGYTDSNTVKFVADTGNDMIHRRTLYTFVKRTSPPPEMSTFDAPSRESCCVRRERTNTPLQALLLLNDPQYFEAAQALTGRVVEANGKTAADRAAYLYRLCTARHATDETITELVGLFENQLTKYEHDEAAAKEIIGSEQQTPDQSLCPSEMAAWTIVANVILNMDEVVTNN